MFGAWNVLRCCLCMRLPSSPCKSSNDDAHHRQQILKIRQMFCAVCVCAVARLTIIFFKYLLRLPSSFFSSSSDHFSLIHSSPFIQFTNRHSRYRIISIIKTFNSLSIYNSVAGFPMPISSLFRHLSSTKKLKYALSLSFLKLKGFSEPTNLLSL